MCDMCPPTKKEREAKQEALLAQLEAVGQSELDWVRAGEEAYKRKTASGKTVVMFINSLDFYNAGLSRPAFLSFDKEHYSLVGGILQYIEWEN